MVVKSKVTADHLIDLGNVFEILRNINCVLLPQSVPLVLVLANFGGI